MARSPLEAFAAPAKASRGDGVGVIDGDMCLVGGVLRGRRPAPRYTVCQPAGSGRVRTRRRRGLGRGN